MQQKHLKTCTISIFKPKGLGALLFFFFFFLKAIALDLPANSGFGFFFERHRLKRSVNTNPVPLEALQPPRLARRLARGLYGVRAVQ